MKLKTKELTTCALFAALIAIGAFIKVDIPVPMYTMHFTFQWFCVMVSGFLLGTACNSWVMMMYLNAWRLSSSVFSAGGGPAYIFRPGFGFLLGFVLAAFVIGTITEKVGKNHKGMFLMASVAGLVTYYTSGAIYFYCINNFYAATPVSWSVVVVEYCLITIAPDFILCVLATAFSRKAPSASRMMHEYSMDRKVV